MRHLFLRSAAATLAALAAGSVLLARPVPAAAAAASAVVFAGESQRAGATEAWTVAFTSSATGELAAEGTLTATFRWGFVLPIAPEVELLEGFVACTATAETRGESVIVHLQGRGCALPPSTRGTLRIPGITNPRAASYAAATVGLATSSDTREAYPEADILIVEATAPPPGSARGPGAGRFAAAPVFGSGGAGHLALAVFTGGTVEELDVLLAIWSVAGAWAQDAGGAYRLYIRGGGAVNRDFVTAFPAGFPHAIAMTLARP